MNNSNAAQNPESGGEKGEGKAPAAAKQIQGFPQNLHGDCSKSDAAAQVVPLATTCGAEGGHSPPQLPAVVPASIMAKTIKRYCVLTDEEVDAIVLWVIASYMIDSFRVFPKLSLISPEKRCGKTTTMETIHAFSKDGLMVSNLSAASIYRITEQRKPTLFIDEADTFLRNGDADLIGLINSSHNKAGASVMRCVGESYHAKSFSTWMPKVLASIGDLPPTVMDRSVVVNLRRKKRHERTELVPVDIAKLQEPIRLQINGWCKLNESAIRAVVNRPPDVGNDRAADNWQPLFAVAEVIGGDWPNQCEAAYRKLTQTAVPELPTQLLLDIREYFSTASDTRVGSADLVKALCADGDGPWCACNHGRKLTPAHMASLLRPYGIVPSTFRFGSSTRRGYELSQFRDAFERYLP